MFQQEHSQRQQIELQQSRLRYTSSRHRLASSKISTVHGLHLAGGHSESKTFRGAVKAKFGKSIPQWVQEAFVAYTGRRVEGQISRLSWAQAGRRVGGQAGRREAGMRTHPY